MRAFNKSSHLSRTVVDAFRHRLSMNGKRFVTLMAALLLFPVMMSAFTVSGLEFSITSSTERTVSVGGVEGLSGNVVIPKTVTDNGVTYTVTRIADYGFEDFTAIKSVTIPASVTEIGNYAFWNCTGLTSVTIPSSVVSIGPSAFSWCTGLTSITIPGSVTSIGSYAFHECSNLTTVISAITEPFQTGDKAFVYLPDNARLLVPSGTESKYTSLSDWSRFNNLGGIHPIVKYPIEVCGVQVTDSNKDDVLAGYSGRYSQKGKVSYDPDTKVLTLDNVTLSHNGLYTLQTRNWGGTIELKGTNRIVNDNWYALSMADGTISSSAGTGSLQCTGNDAGMVIDGTYSRVYIKNCTVSIDGLLYGLEGSGGTLNIEGSEVTIRNSSPTSSAAKGSIYGVTLATDDERICQIVSPANVKYDSTLKGYVVSGESALTKEPVVVSYKRDRYGLYICGDEVTASNCTDVTGSWLKRGKVSYDPKTATLTLDNVLTDCSDEIAIKADEYYMGHGITINLVGDNKLTGSADNRFAYLALDGGWEVGMTISSSSGGTLTADHIFCSAVFPLTIRDCTVRLTDYIEDDDPVRLVVDNAALIVGSPGNVPKASYVYWIQRPLEMNGCYIAWPENGYNEGGFIYDDKGNKVTDYVAILPDGKTLDDYGVMAGDVNSDGHVDINDVVAIINVMAGNAKWPNADVNGDTGVDINDVVAVINIMASGGNVIVYTVNGVKFGMVSVEGGTFQMGSDANNDEKPVHEVTISDYAIGQTEVTQELWQAVMGSNPSEFKGDKLPVDNVSWNDCQEFITKLNGLTGKHFRLPTEAEWEYAARGGSKSKGYMYSGSDNVGDVAYYKDNSEDKTHPVATKKSNELGIYDMTGNVREWCQDWYAKDYYSNSPALNPTGPTSGHDRVLRGGGWDSYAESCRVSYRNFNRPDYCWNGLGLRLAL